MSKYNNIDPNDKQPKKCLKKTMFNIRRFVVWARTNPLKATILFLSIIIFILIIVVIAKSVELGGFDAKYDKLEEQKDAIVNEKNNLIQEGKKKDTNYKSLYNEALYFKGQLFNQYKGIEHMLKLWESEPDFLRYGDQDGLSTRLRAMYYNKEKNGGKFTSDKLRYEGRTVLMPSLKGMMEKEKLKINGFFTIRGI